MPTILREPKPAQVLAMQYAFPRSRIALFMQMRLGKNLVTIRWAKHHKLERILVVATPDNLDVWRDELLLEGVASSDIYVLTGSRLHKYWQASEVDTGWVIVNYEAIRGQRRRDWRSEKVLPDRVGAELLQLPWSGIVLDESTAIRNPAAKTTKAFLRFSGHILCRAILTGLPNPQSEMDFFSQMTFLNGSFMGSHNFWSWRQRNYYEPSGLYDWQWMPKKGVKDVIKAEVHKHAFFLTRKEAGVGEQRVFEKRYVEMTPSQRKLYRQVEKDFAYGDLETNWATVKTVWLARIAGGFSPDKENPKCLNPAKIKSVVNLLKTELADEPVVIWFRFNQELYAVARALHEAKISYTKIVGGDRERNIRNRKKFQRGKVRVILMQLKIGKFGWDLSRADTEIRFSETYDYEEYSQSRDRIVSVHKHVPLLSISLITRGTIDEDVADVIQDKDITSRTFRMKLKERLHASFNLRYPKRIMPGDK